VDNPGETLGPVMAISGDQSNAIAVPFDPEAIAIRS
jgi:hypothetical protein